jgi:CRP-like cAMP-binding protein
MARARAKLASHFAKPAIRGVGTQSVRNKLLLALPKGECTKLFSELEFVLLPSGTILNEADARIKFAYFVNEGLASVLTVMPRASNIEVGLCGREGFVGMPIMAGFQTSHARTIMQVNGSGFRISATQLVAALRECPKLAIGLQRYVQELALQACQVAACNRLHRVEERLARWLLMCADRIESETLPVTQESLSQMLGTRRASVTVAAGALQKAGYIAYRRGTMRIVNRTGLERASCDCYRSIAQQIKKWHAEAI